MKKNRSRMFPIMIHSACTLLRSSSSCALSTTDVPIATSFDMAWFTQLDESPSDMSGFLAGSKNFDNISLSDSVSRFCFNSLVAEVLDVCGRSVLMCQRTLSSRAVLLLKFASHLDGFVDEVRLLMLELKTMQTNTKEARMRSDIKQAAAVRMFESQLTRMLHVFIMNLSPIDLKIILYLLDM